MSKRESSPDGARGPAGDVAMALADVRGVLVAWTAGASRLLGYRPDEAVGRRVADLLAGDPPSAALSSIGRGDAWGGRVTARHRDGHELELDVELVPMEDADGGGRWAMVAREPDGARGPDGTMALLKERALAELPLAFGVFDRDRRLVAASGELVRIMDMKEEELLGLRPRAMTDSRTSREFDDVLGKVIRTGERSRLDAFTRVPGEDRAHGWSAVLYPVRDSGGRIQGGATVSFDITGEDLARQRLTVVNEASVRLGTDLDVTRTAQQLADLATGRFADHVTVDLLRSVIENDRPDLGAAAARMVYRRAAQQSVLDDCPEASIATGESECYPEDSPMARALATGEASLHMREDLSIQSWLAHDAGCSEKALTYGMHSLILVPLRARGLIIGLARFIRHRTPDRFDADDLMLAEEITGRAAICIDNARRYTQERDTALALQRSMLPQRTPPHPAVTVASRYLPTGSQAGVGGDWFDVIPLSGSRVALVVGDVVGHGIQASATMGRLRTAVRTLADVDMPPDELLTHLDDVVLRMDREEGMDRGGVVQREAETGDIGASCLYAVYDPVSRTCVLARAGHPAPAIVGPDGTVEYPDLPAGPPLGLGGLPFESTELTVPDGALLALFTDGLIESGGHDADAGLQRLGRVLSDNAAAPLELVCDRVLSTMLPGGPADDIALLLARTQGLNASQVATWDLAPDPAVVGRARQAASDQLTAWGLDEPAFTTELVVSELVTNAIRYGEPPIRLRLIHTTGLICEVSDSSNTAPHLRRARIFDEGGRGLLLVAQLTRRWGTRHTSHGKTIWAEQSLPQINTASAPCG
ncbi:SpoIIE family protein phosphatase [Actinomadura viridis]|uniref:PAS domain S-box-containing protein n=1 Tax=Actinomadura viridis TaxID=58110 RepID=A0A931DAV6_9ACTN|nr:SpoIIE family protein phosphatase [Actinomadura viridis]MBG6087689.1 PAS domain S-box-containing protein [Actinomadura viridis]